MTNDTADHTPTNPGFSDKVGVKASAEPRVFEQVFRLFKSQLVSGELKPSDRLLPERELAQKLGVSRPSLREVMRALDLLGVVEIRPGQGTFIRRPDLSILQDFFGLVLAMEPTLYEHLMETRIALECRAIRLACRQGNPEDHARLSEALHRIRNTVDDPNMGAEADFDFHAAIVRASQNQVLLLMHEAIAAQLRRSHHERRESLRGTSETQMLLTEDHVRIYDAIRTGDPERAEMVLKEHYSLAQRANEKLTARPG
ncbi:MAG: transcriptional regulator, GntR family [Devosia sp.]|nr:transcriptional regulator, GntR family [Devosia sp.]